MGYYTNYMLKTTEGYEHLIDVLRGQSDGARFALQPDGHPCDMIKWYDHESDLAFISKQYPEVLFTLSGDGEESGDIWKKYFKGGKKQVARAQIVIDEFDETKLE